LKEPVFTLDVNSIKNREGIGSWWDLTETVLWKADDKSLVTETPKIKIVFSGPSDYEIEATVSMEEKEKGDKPWNKVKYNAEFTIPKNTFKDKEGKYVVDVILTYKTQNVKETTKFEYRPWKADQKFDTGGFEKSKLKFKYETRSGQEPGTYIGSYTLKADANKTYDTPMNGKIEGTDLYDVIDKTKSAAESQ
jgi:hypothetical protein